MVELVDKRPEHRYDAYIEGEHLVTVDEMGPQQLVSPDQKPIGQRTTIIHDRVDMADSNEFVTMVAKQVEQLNHARVKAAEQMEALKNIGAPEIGPRLDALLELGQKLSPGKAGMDKLERLLKRIGPQLTQWANYKQASFNHDQLTDQHKRASEQLKLIRHAMEAKDGAKAKRQHLATR